MWHHSLPPLTMKFKRWNTFWVVQPYSGTRSSIRISWICKQQFVSYWGKENSQVVESDIEITFNKFKQHKCKGLKLNFWKQPHIDMFNLHILRHNIHMHSETLRRASIHDKVAVTHSHFSETWTEESQSWDVCVISALVRQSLKSLRISCTRHYKS